MEAEPGPSGDAASRPNDCPPWGPAAEPAAADWGRALVSGQPVQALAAVLQAAAQRVRASASANATTPPTKIIVTLTNANSDFRLRRSLESAA